MTLIGYIRLRHADFATDVADLEALGCHLVLTEAPTGRASVVMEAILDAIRVGDQLVVSRLPQLGPTHLDCLEILDRLDRRGAHLHIADHQLSTEGVGGRALRAALEVMIVAETSRGELRSLPRRLRAIRALQSAGLGPAEIARRLGVSRMTIWRSLKAADGLQS